MWYMLAATLGITRQLERPVCMVKPEECAEHSPRQGAGKGRAPRRERGAARTIALLLVMVHPLIVAVPIIIIAPMLCVTRECTCGQRAWRLPSGIRVQPMRTVQEVSVAERAPARCCCW
jgi:hypothetical protein